MAPLSRSRHAAVVPDAAALPRFLLLYAGLFAAFGVASPFLPALLMEDGLAANELGLVLGAGTAIRLVAGPLGGRLADRSGRAPLVLAGLTALAALVALLYGPARGLLALLLVGLLHAAVLAPLTPVADALATADRRPGRGFAYGWVRAAGSGAFILGALGSGLLVESWGLGVVIWLNAGLLAVAAGCALRLPHPVADPATRQAAAAEPGALAVLAGSPAYVRLMLVAALIGGSHALHDAFGVIRWRQAGLSAAQCGALWSLAVAAEIAVFLLFGRGLLARLGPGRAVMLAAAAGVLRWGVEAETAALPALALVEPLHGFTFALLHLACVGGIAGLVPSRYAATAQALYATVALGLGGALATTVSGPLYGALGPRAFWIMAALCAAALPLARRLGPAGASPPATRPAGGA